jgi:thiol-disulfide isomerase/thioredoxin
MRFCATLLLLLLCFSNRSYADRGYEANTQLARFAVGDFNRLSFKNVAKPAPITLFESKNGLVTLAQYKGKVVVLNLWATWCAPCLKELPGLDRLAGAMKGSDVVVLAISQDVAGWRAVDPWWRNAKLKHLAPHIDKKMNMAFGYGIISLPLTLIYDRQGREVARLSVPAVWDSANAQALLRAIAGAK